MLALVALVLLAAALPAPAAAESCAISIEWRGNYYVLSESRGTARPGRVLGEGKHTCGTQGPRIVVRRLRGLPPARAVWANAPRAGIYRFVALRDEEPPTNWLAAGLISAAVLVPLAYVVFVRR